MPDNAEIVKDLQEAAEYFRERRQNASFASEEEDQFWKLQYATSEAADLVKKQDPVKPVKKNDGVQKPWTSWWYVCGSRGREIDVHDQFCRHCGSAVKWE